jgi:hypothetical protein
MEIDPGKRIVAYRSTFLCGGQNDLYRTIYVLIWVFYYSPSSLSRYLLYYLSLPANIHGKTSRTLWSLATTVLAIIA